MMYRTILLLLCISISNYSFFDYDRAIGYAQKNLWQDAGNILNRIVAKDPDNPELVYDAGVVAFNNKDYQQAKAYFESTAQNDKAPKGLKAQAYFNKGNTHVALEELKEALLSYEQALMLNPDDQQAKHNHEVVKKMLEQQEHDQQQQDQKSDKQNKKDRSKDQSRDQQKDNQKQEHNRESSDDQHSSDGKQQNDLDNSQADNEKDNAESENSKGEGLDQERDQEDRQKDGADQEEDDSQEDKERNERSDSNQKSEPNQEKSEQQKESKHESPSDKNEMEQQQQNKQGEQKEQEIDEEEDSEGVALDPRLERVLEKRSDRDAQLNKQMVRALVSQDMKGRHGQNCW